MAARLDVGGQVAFADWEEALRAAVRLPGSGSPLLLVLDEFPYLLRHSPEVPSILQMLYDESRSVEGRDVRIILCGSAMSIMSRLLSGIGAISQGRSTPGRIASALGRDEGGIRHVLSMLERAHLIERDQDVLRRRRPMVRVADPILRVDQLVIRPHLAALEAREPERVWAASAATVAAQIAGPHFERLARE